MDSGLTGGRGGGVARALAAAVVAAAIGAPAAAGAWGLDVHRLITRRAVDGLPAELRPYFAAEREFIAERSIDPDLWRTVGLRGELGDEPPNHFLDIDGLDEPPPFRNVPRDWNAYVARYGAERAHRMGRLPWRAEEIFQLLVKAFEDVGRGAAFGGSNARYLSAVLAHYIEDAHQPFHGALNYDGQLTNQHGIHARFETQLVLKYRDVLNLRPVAIRPIHRMRDFIFDTLVESQSLVQGILDADRRATAAREFYDDAYFAELFTATRPVLERRLAESASAVASAIVGAWELAGRPKMPEERPAAPARIRR